MAKRQRNPLKELVQGRMPGALPLFNEFHLRRALGLIAEGEIGRGKLAKRLGLGEGSARTVVKILMAGGLIKTSRRGCELTQKGAATLKEYLGCAIEVHSIEAGKLALGKRAVAVLVRRAGRKVRYGIEQRDAALKAGATGATTIVYRAGKLTAPAISDDVEKEFPQLAEVILSIFKPKENDVIVIGSADDEIAAGMGAEAAASTLED